MSYESAEDARLQAIWERVNSDRVPTADDIAASRAMADQTVAMLSEPKYLDDEFGNSEFGREFVRRVLIAHHKSRNEDFVEYIDPDGIFDPDDPSQVSGVRFLIFANNPEVAHVVRPAHSVDAGSDCMLKVSDRCCGFGDFDAKIVNGQYVIAVAYCVVCREWLSKNVGKLEEFDV